MTTILDIAIEDGEKLAKQSAAVLSSAGELKDVSAYFIKKRFSELYRAQIIREYGRNPSKRECLLALKEAQEAAEDG